MFLCLPNVIKRAKNAENFSPNSGHTRGGEAKMVRGHTFLRFLFCWTLPLFSRSEQSTLFRLGSRTISGIRNEFRGMYLDNMSCPVCPQNSHTDTIPKLIYQNKVVPCMYGSSSYMCNKLQVIFFTSIGYWSGIK